MLAPKRFETRRRGLGSNSEPPARTLGIWFAVMIGAGLAFGLIGDRRPFGEGLFAHPLMMLFTAATAGILVLRVIIARPVPEIIPERMLLFGCFAALAAFLVGNIVAARLPAF